MNSRQGKRVGCAVPGLEGKVAIESGVLAGNRSDDQDRRIFGVLIRRPKFVCKDNERIAILTCRKLAAQDDLGLGGVVLGETAIHRYKNRVRGVRGFRGDGGRITSDGCGELRQAENAAGLVEFEENIGDEGSHREDS